MKIGGLVFQITTVAVFLQLLLGGLLTFDFINAGVHIVTGLVVFALAIIAKIVSILTRPRSYAMQLTSVVLVVLIIIQIVLGFDTLDSGNQVIAWIHFANAMVIYGVAIIGTFVALRLDQTAKVLPSAKGMLRE